MEIIPPCFPLLLLNFHKLIICSTYFTLILYGFTLFFNYFVYFGLTSPKVYSKGKDHVLNSHSICFESKHIRIKKCLVDNSEHSCVIENGEQISGEAAGRTKFQLDIRKTYNLLKMDQVDSESDESFVPSSVQTETQRTLDNEDLSQELKVWSQKELALTPSSIP